MSSGAFECNRKDCVVNNYGICMGLYRKAHIATDRGEGYIHLIDEKWIEKCPFFLNKEMEAKDLAKLKERLGIDGRRRK